MATRAKRKHAPFRKGKRWGIDERDSKKHRDRRTFETKEEAQRAIDEIRAQMAAGEYYTSAKTWTFNDALDLLAARTTSKKHRKLARKTIDRVKSDVDVHLREESLGHRKLSEFPASRMQFVKDFLDEKAKTYASRSLARMHSNIKLALDLAIDKEMMGAPNPMNLFNVGVPVGQDPEKRRALTLEEIFAMVGGALVRLKHERELTFASRFVLVMLGLLAGLRDQECSGLCWDCLDMDGRVLFVRRIWRAGEGLIAGTKTGELGFRDIPLSPVLHAVLIAYRERLRELGYPVEGNVPVLRTERVDLIVPEAITSQHWDSIAAKAGFVGREGNNLTFYNLRHTAACMWRTVGLDLEHLKWLMGHKDFKTTSDNYSHRTPTFNVLRREVAEFGSERTPEFLIDALGIVLAHRWREAGLNIPWSPPIAMTSPRLAHDEQQALLAGPPIGNGQLIDLRPDEITTTRPIRSLKELREWQRSEAKRLDALGWKHARIADQIGIDKTTVSNMVRGSDDQIWLRKLGHAERAELRDRARRMRIEQDATNAEIGRELRLSPHRVSIWLRGLPMKNWRRAPTQKYARHEALIRRRVAEGKTLPEIARELGFPRDTGVRAFVARLGLEPKKRRYGHRQPVARNSDSEILARVTASWTKRAPLPCRRRSRALL